MQSSPPCSATLPEQTAENQTPNQHVSSISYGDLLPLQLSAMPLQSRSDSLEGLALTAQFF